MDYKLKYENAVNAILPSAIKPSDIDLVTEIRRILELNKKLGETNLKMLKEKVTVIKAIDNYGGLRFKPLEKLEYLKVGMMVQILENNTSPATWMWLEITESLLIKFARDENSISYIRIPVYL